VLSLADGVAAVHLARRALRSTLGASSGDEPAGLVEESALPPVFDEMRGAFVTLKRFPGNTLRGCIGYPLPVLPLRAAIARSAVAAAVEDYRFRPVRAADLPHIAVEVSVLTTPVPLHFSRPEEAIRAVKVGRDELIVDGLGSRGLLLPQVAPEEGWTAEELLDGTCEKAGLPARSWRDPRVTVKRFEAEIFRELAPGGKVVREDPLRPTSDGRPARKN